MKTVHLTHADIHRFSDVVADAQLSTPLVAVYCGSKSGHNPVFTQTAYELGQALAVRGLGLVYGGACIGVMGAVADGVLSEHGTTVGVIPTFLQEKEVAHDRLSVLYTTDSMHTRKALMAEFASAFVALAGGLGTLEELMEVATWRQLYQHEKPIIIVNTNGFYDGLLQHLKNTVAAGFMSEADLTRLVVCQTVDEALACLLPLVATEDELDVEKF